MLHPSSSPCRLVRCRSLPLRYLRQPPFGPCEMHPAEVFCSWQSQVTLCISHGGPSKEGGMNLIPVHDVGALSVGSPSCSSWPAPRRVGEGGMLFGSQLAALPRVPGQGCASVPEDTTSDSSQPTVPTRAFMSLDWLTLRVDFVSRPLHMTTLPRAQHTTSTILRAVNWSKSSPRVPEFGFWTISFSQIYRPHSTSTALRAPLARVSNRKPTICSTRVPVPTSDLLVSSRLSPFGSSLKTFRWHLLILHSLAACELMGATMEMRLTYLSV
ncbi:hypothetical protein B0T19DRAFT_289261 [Cercophora scortea]|uniref:Uncharacterized protein n=1 Tax=Cercophora scortea TaxID=314031 RepID=A0AAE0M3G5_9PEZI|nr:hypothetical protein B0T19DRAFT_289261 [Cercophora scortea]